MPDIIDSIYRRWKTIALLISTATLLALAISLLQPKEYIGTVTGVPANSALADKARLFNNNIEALYPELGTIDELDRIEGISKLDTLYLSVAAEQNLVSYYGINADAQSLYKAAMKLKKTTNIRRSAYGELKINVWDKDPLQAALLANALFTELNTIYQHTSETNNERVLAQLKSGYAQKKVALDSMHQLMSHYEGSRIIDFNSSDSAPYRAKRNGSLAIADFAMLPEQIKEYERIISQYELALNTSMQPLIVVENARPAFYADKPKIFQTVLFAFGASLILSVLLAVFIESRNQRL